MEGGFDKASLGVWKETVQRPSKKWVLAAAFRVLWGLVEGYKLGPGLILLVD